MSARVRRRPSGELLVAVGVVLATVGSLMVQSITEARGTPLLLALPAVAAVGLHRRRPLIALAAGVVVLIGVSGDELVVLPVLLVLYWIGVRQTWSSAVLGGITITAASALAVVCWGDGAHPSGTVHLVCGVVTQGAAALALGLCVAARRNVVEERAERQVREHALLTEQALGQERLRIARELHDVIAHNVSLMVVQAQALGATARDPAVGTTTDAIADLGRTTMVEMHRTLRLLRADAASPPLAPQPGLADLSGLVAQTRAAGLDVELVVEGEPRPLSQTADLSVFRIVQEALTNVLKHATDAATTVTISYAREGLAVTVVDDGPQGGNTSLPARGGLGLAGMHERAALFGGTFTAAPRQDRGFEVTATLPYGAPAG